jgi:type VI secretion system protein ImpC
MPDPQAQLSLEQWAPAWESQAWRDLRQSPQSAWSCLAWPRYLLRLPYGPETSPVESFAMSERVAAHDDYLWGSPAVIMAGLVAQSFTKYGWQLRPGDPRRVAGLPVHIQTVAGEAQAHPCGELLIDEKMAQHLLRQGVTPLLSVRDQDQVEIRTPLGLNGQPLAGPWS